jgi:hypothetical protein
MRYLIKDGNVVGADDGEDVYGSPEALESRLNYHQTQLAALSKSESAGSVQRAGILLHMADLYHQLEKNEECWNLAREAFSDFADSNDWNGAVEACYNMVLSEQSDALTALGHGIWLGVTYPIDLELSMAMLQMLVDESPKEADTRAIAAAASSYLADVRSEKGKNDDLVFFAHQMLGRVAEEHSQVEGKMAFDIWVRSLELDDPAVFLPKLSGVVDQLVSPDGWWIDRDVLREELPH